MASSTALQHRLVSRHRRYPIGDTGRLFSPLDFKPRAWWNVDNYVNALTLFNTDNWYGFWGDASGNGHHWSCGSGNNYPKLQFNTANGYPSWHFYTYSGTARYFDNATGMLTGLTAGELFLVVKAVSDAPVTNQGFNSFGNSDALNSHYPWQDGNVFDGFMTTVRKSCGNPSPALTSWHVAHFISSSSEWTYNVNGSQVYTTGTNTVNTSGTVRLGASVSTVYYFDGDIAEGVLYGSLTASQRSVVLAYLKSKFAIS